MMSSSTPVDEAMKHSRPAKARVRSEWLRIVTEMSGLSPREETLYVTLCGAAGHDVQMLLDARLVEVSETGAIVDEDKARIVAIESSVNALAQIRSRFVGLRVIPDTLINFVGGRNPLRYPVNSTVETLRARVINLDFNQGVGLRSHEQRGLESDVLVIAERLMRMHAQDPIREPWALLLTAHGEATWGTDVDTALLAVIATARAASEEYSNLLGAELIDLIDKFEGGTVEPLADSDYATQQRAILTYVATRVTQIAFDTGWSTSVPALWRYGGETNSGTAPMCTWIFTFNWSREAFTGDVKAYEESLAGCLRALGYVSEAGDVVDG